VVLCYKASTLLRSEKKASL